MPITPEQREAVANELKRIGPLLHLSEDQRQRLQETMSEASEKVQEYRKQNPNATQEDVIKKIADNPATIRQRVVNFLTPEQLTVWDTEVAKAKEFLGHKLAA